MSKEISNQTATYRVKGPPLARRKGTQLPQAFQPFLDLLNTGNIDAELNRAVITTQEGDPTMEPLTVGSVGSTSANHRVAHSWVDVRNEHSATRNTLEINDSIATGIATPYTLGSWQSPIISYEGDPETKQTVLVTQAIIPADADLSNYFNAPYFERRVNPLTEAWSLRIERKIGAVAGTPTWADGSVYSKQYVNVQFDYPSLCDEAYGANATGGMEDFDGGLWVGLVGGIYVVHVSKRSPLRGTWPGLAEVSYYTVSGSYPVTAPPAPDTVTNLETVDWIWNGALTHIRERSIITDGSTISESSNGSGAGIDLPVSDPTYLSYATKVVLDAPAGNDTYSMVVASNVEPWSYNLWRKTTIKIKYR